MEPETVTPPPETLPQPHKKRAASMFSAELLAALSLVCLLLCLLAYFTLPYTSVRKRNAAATHGGTAQQALPQAVLGNVEDHTSGAPNNVGTAEEPTAEAPTFDVFRHPESKPAEAIALKDRDVVHGSDGFTFELHNRTGKPAHFMLFAMDAGDTLFWFFPQVDPEKQHASLPLGPFPNAVIPEGVTPGDVKPGLLRMVGLFTPEPVTISEVEDGFRQHGPQGIAQALNGEMQVMTLQLDAG